MARQLPDYREKQKILYIDKTPKAKLVEYGDAFLKEGRVFDALEFYGRAGHDEGLSTILARARDEGDAMLYQQALKALGREADGAEWREVARRAEARGKLTFGRFAAERGGVEKPPAGRPQG